MEELQRFIVEPPQKPEDVQAVGALPRPWDPGTCTGELRRELWDWLGDVAFWINEQHLWNIAVGIPECWPAHPHIVHDLAVVACARYDTAFALTPTALDEWHRYCLPGFLDRLARRLADGCQPGQHTEPPRTERNRHFQAAAAHDLRTRLIDSEPDDAGTPDDPTAKK